MSQVTPRASRARKARKAPGTQATAVLASTPREPLISGVTDGETFQLIVEPREAAKRGAPARQEPRGLFDELETPSPQLLPAPVKSRSELSALGLAYRFALGCSADGPDEV
jgi:hypothetical protein